LCGVGISKGDAQRFHFCNFFNVVTFVRCRARKSIQPCTRRRSRRGSRCGCRRIQFSFDQSTHFRFAVATRFAESAQCPESLGMLEPGQTATFMIAGDRCTRACGFCAVTTAKPFALEDDEPKRVAEAVRRMNLKHVVITAVARRTILTDGGG